MTTDLNIRRSGDFTPAVTEFRGKLSGMSGTQEDNPFRPGEKRSIAHFTFTEMEVLEAREPLNITEWTIDINMNDSVANTPWGVFGDSVIEILGQESLDPLKGKVQRWKWAPAKLTKRDQETGEFKVQPSRCWQVMEVEGYETTNDGESSEGSNSTSLIGQLAEVADGKTEEEFLTYIFSDEGEKFKKHPEWLTLQQKIIDREIVSDMEGLNLVTKDSDGVMAKV